MRDAGRRDMLRAISEIRVESGLSGRGTVRRLDSLSHG
jgi:hypothetical protein